VSAARPTPHLLIAHRGSPARAPENTLASLARAVEEGASCIECDVRLSRDGVPVLMHDATLQRTTDRSGYVSAHTHAELAEADAGAWFDASFAGSGIPTLEDVLVWRPMQVRMMLELKRGGLGVHTTRDLAEAVVARIHAASAVREVIVTSFSHAVLRAVRTLDGEIELGQLQYGPAIKVGLVRRLERVRAAWYIRSVRTVGAADVRDMHAAGIRVAVYTANTARDVRHALECGVDAIITNELPFVRSLLQDWQ
jgi:glycerophosphoryl diester phosphodiesterase